MKKQKRMAENEFCSVKIVRSYFGMSVTDDIMKAAVALLCEAVDGGILRTLGMEADDGHVTILYGHVPSKGKEIGKKLNELVELSKPDIRMDRFMVERVTVGFDERAVIAILDPNYGDLRPLFADLYKNVEYCRGHPDFRGPDKLIDPLWMERTPHVTLMRFEDKGAAKMAAGILQQKIAVLRHVPIVLQHFFAKVRYDIGGQIVDEDIIPK